MTNDIARKIQIGTQDLGSYVEWGPIRARGGDRVIKSDTIPGSHKAVLWEEGRKALGYQLGLIFAPGLSDQIAEYDAVVVAIDDAEDGDVFYPGRDDRYALVYFGSCHEPSIAPAAGDSGIIRADAEFWSEAAELYAATPSSWSPTDEQLPITQATGEENAGNLEAGLYSLALTARMSGPALEFDGTDDYVTGTYDLSGDLLSIELWICPESETADKSIGFSNGASATTSGHLHFVYEQDTHAIKGFVGDGAAGLSNTFGSSDKTNIWTHLILTYSKTAGAAICYLNGAKLGDTWSETLISLVSTDIYIGKHISEYSDGAIAFCRIWKRVLSAAEALAAFNGETVDDTSLAIEYDFCEGRGATVYDLSGNSNDGTLTNFADTSAGYGDTHDSGWLTSIGPMSPTLNLISPLNIICTLAGTNIYDAGTPETFSGSTYRYFVIRYRTNSGTPAGQIYYRTAGHSWSGSYRKDVVLVNDGIWHTLVADMHSLTAGGTDWATNTILGLRFQWNAAQNTDVLSVAVSTQSDGSWPYISFPLDEWSTTGATISGADTGSLALSPSLMTSEVLEVDRFGQITQTYVDDFTADVGRPAFSNGYFWTDGYSYAKYIDSEIVLTSLISGRVGEEITIKLTDPGGNDQTISVGVSGYDIDVDLDTGPAGAITTTAQGLIDAINADDDAKLLVLASLATGEDGDTVVDAQAETNLDLNVNVTGGALVIEDDREAEYHLPGVFPIVTGGLVVTFTPTIAGTLTGTDVLALEASADSGATWETVIDSDDEDWTDGEEMEVYVPDSIAKGQTEVWIRFVCPTSATSLSIDDLTIYQERAVSDSVLPKIPAGATYKTQIDGAGWGDAAATWRNRFKP